MGWSSGSGLMDDIIDIIQNQIFDDKKRIKIYTGIIQAMEDHDWDCQNECLGEDPAFDIALSKLHPDWYEDKED